MSKKLTLADIKSEVKKYSEKQRIDLSGGFHTFIYPYFSPSKISTLIQNLLQDGIEAKEKGIDLESVNQIDWFLFNIIATFADLGIPNNIKKKVEVYIILRDSDHFEEIVQSFPQESLDKVNKALVKAKENLDEILKDKKIDINKAVEEATKEENIAIE